MTKLEVRLSRDPGQERIVGQLAEAGPRSAGGQVVFEYDPAFLRDPLWLSPFKLPPQPGLIEHRDHSFGPIFGLFDDSLPDGWGLLLMDRFFRQRGSALAEVSVLDRLAYLGTRTMGALTYHPPADPADLSPQQLDLHGLARASQRVVEGTAGEVLPQLLRAGGSPGGARPKVLPRGSRIATPNRFWTPWRRPRPAGESMPAKRESAPRAPGWSRRRSANVSLDSERSV